jgi:MFS family permease
VRNEWTSHLPKEDVQSSANEGKNFSIPSGLMLLGFIAGTMSTVPMTYMPFELRNLGVASSAAVAAALMVPVIVSGLVSGLFGHVRKRTSSGILFALSFGVAGIGAAITAISTSYTEIICGLFLYGAGIGWLTPNLMSVATEVASAATRGRIVGIVNGAFYSATFIAVLILEPIVRATGPKGALFTMMALSLMASLFFIVGARERRSA